MLPIRSLFQTSLEHFCAQNTKNGISIRFSPYTFFKLMISISNIARSAAHLFFIFVFIQHSICFLSGCPPHSSYSCQPFSFSSRLSVRHEVLKYFLPFFFSCSFLWKLLTFLLLIYISLQLIPTRLKPSE